jgi:hypothetical protein
MKDITLSISEKDYSFFMKLIKKLDFVQVKAPKQTKISASKQQFLVVYQFEELMFLTILLMNQI